MLMWGLAIPVLYCLLFRLGIGLSLLLAQEFSAIFLGAGGGGSPSAVAGGERGVSLPGLERIGWGSWMDILGDWCGGVGLMIGGLVGGGGGGGLVVGVGVGDGFGHGDDDGGGLMIGELLLLLVVV